MTCTCKYQFCFNCLQEWDEEHICASRLGNRTGIGFVCHILLKILICIPLLVCIIGGILIFSLFFCCLSAFFAGLLLFFKLIEFIQSSKISDCGKFTLLILLLIFFPLLIIICLLPGFITPLINICMPENIIMDPNILPTFCRKLMACFKVLMRI